MNEVHLAGKETDIFLLVEAKNRAKSEPILGLYTRKHAPMNSNIAL